MFLAGFDKHAHCARYRNKLKGDDPCVSKKPCSFCDILMPEQKLQISIPSYQKKKEKLEQRTALAAKSSENVSETMVYPSLVSVVGVASSKSKPMKSPDTATKDKQKRKHSTPVKKSTTDAKLEAMDQRWSEHFSRLEALFLSKSMEKSDLTFQTVKMPAKSLPAGAVKGSEPFILPKPVDRPVDRLVMATDQARVEAQYDRPSALDSHQPADQPSH